MTTTAGGAAIIDPITHLQVSKLTGLPLTFFNNTLFNLTEVELVVMTCLQHYDERMSYTDNLRTMGFSDAFLEDTDAKFPVNLTFEQMLSQLFGYAFDTVHDELCAMDTRGYPVKYADHPVRMGSPSEWPAREEAGPRIFLLPAARLDCHEVVARLQLLSSNSLLFHATCWSSALSIMEHGIDVEMSRDNMTDFGPNSFYLHENFQAAVMWAMQRAPHRAALLVYAPNATWLDDITADNKRVFPADASDPQVVVAWQDYVFQCRCPVGGRQHPWTNMHAVKGPIWQGGRLNHSMDVQRLEHHGKCPGQVAVRSDAIARNVFDPALVGVLFFHADANVVRVLG